MPAGVVVVKRARRRSFALLWAALAWIRSLVAGLRKRRNDGAAPTGPVLRAPLFPSLAHFEGQGPSAATLRACLEGCPDDCLSVVSDGDRVLRLMFDPGRCTGCGGTVDRWGQGIFVGIPAPSAIETVHGRVEPIDLLGDADG